LRALGVEKATDELVRYFRDELVTTLPNTDNLYPTSIDDIITIIGSRSWYQQKLHIKRKIIHHVSYKIFRKHYNQWAINAFNQWKKENRIDFIKNENTSTKKRMGKNFIYKNLLLLRASNSICDRVQKCMLQQHGEYIAVRNKNVLEYSYVKIQLDQFEAYIVRPHNDVNKSLNEKQKHIKTLRKALLMAINNNISALEISVIVRDTLKEKDIPIVNVQFQGGK